MDQTCDQCNALFASSDSFELAKNDGLQFTRSKAGLTSVKSQGCLLCAMIQRKWIEVSLEQLEFIARIYGLDRDSPQLSIAANWEEDVSPLIFDIFAETSTSYSSESGRFG